MNLIEVSKRGLMLVLTLSIILGSFSMVSAGVFSDIPENHWARNHIKYLADKDLVSGVKEATYDPDANITRAQFVTMINNALGLSDEVEVADVDFKDVDRDDWFHDAVAKAVEAGYVNGHNDNTFAPNDSITREQAASMVVRAFDLGSASEKIAFLDRSNISSWARSYVDVASQKGYIVGFPDGNFKPNLKITRAQSATIVYRLITGDVAEVPEPPKPEPKPEPSKPTVRKTITMNASAYDLSYQSTGKRPGDRGYGITASGTKARPGVVAVDPKVIPLGTKLYIESLDGRPDYGNAIAEDTGGAIKGNRIDLFFTSRSAALQFGRRNVRVHILD